MIQGFWGVVTEVENELIVILEFTKNYNIPSSAKDKKLSLLIIK